MKIGIAYASRNGSSKQYAQMLQSELACECVEAKKIKSLQCDKIIYVGNLRMNKIDGYAKVVKKYKDKLLAVVAVGITEKSKEFEDLLKGYNKLDNNLKFYYLMGAMKIGSIRKRLDKIMLNTVYNALSSKAQKTPSDKHFISCYINGTSFVDKENIIPIVNDLLQI